MARKVSEVMTPAPVAVPPQCSLVQAAEQMRRHGIGDVLVAEDDRLCGLVTDRDIVVRAVAAGRDMAATPVSEVCSPELVTLTPADDAETAVRLMREHAVRRIPVVDGDRPVGMVSLGDLALERNEHSVLADISAQPPTT
ncbi:CBS domain-containing protein [Thermomonospora echinospora]|uniref:CBS domain-containing protein n=1 Tax=Thermomonospora echinospora TaxID=1992 RepID=A0A1H5VI74_9ACTN|nr:CBS domain-containing protein [Thermomonospora echinospora]SEF86746.1 CBS domain-containing protein [Thermomonospora echinospora]